MKKRTIFRSLSVIMVLIMTLLLSGSIFAAPSSSYLGLNAGDNTYEEAAGTLNGMRFLADLTPLMEQETDMTYAAADVPGAAANGKLYIFGGYGTDDTDYLNYTQEYDPVSDTWTQKALMPTARWGAAAAELNGKIYVFGGTTNGNNASNKCEVFDLGTNSWATKATLPSFIPNGIMAVTVNPYIYLFYGNDTWRFDPNGNGGTGSYTLMAGSPVWKKWATAAYVNVGGEGRIYIIGGSNVTNTFQNTNYYYVPGTDTWSSAQAAAPFAAHGVTRDNPVYNGKIYYGLGWAGREDFRNTIYAYDPTSDTWSDPLAHGIVARDGVGCGIIGDSLYIAGGRSAGLNPFGLDNTESILLESLTGSSANVQELGILFDDATTSGDVRLGIYADDNGVPGSLLLDAGAVAVADGWVSIAGLSLLIDNGTYYWLAFNLENANDVRYRSAQAVNSHYEVSEAYGALPAQFNVADAHYNDDQYVMRAVLNIVPIAANDAYRVVTNTVLNVASPGVLGNDTDIDGDPLTAVLVSDVSDGNLTLNSDGSFSYTPDPGFAGFDSFTYQANDGGDNSNVATVTIEVVTTFGLDEGDNSWNESADTLNAMMLKNIIGTGTITQLEMLFDDTTPTGNVRLGVYADNNGLPGNLLVDAGEVAVADGWVSISGLSVPVVKDAYYWLAFNLESANGVAYQSEQPANSHCWVSAAYGPLPDPYTLYRSHKNANQYVMRATVNPIGNQIPVAVDDSYGVPRDSVLTVVAPGVLGNDTDADGDPLTAVLVSDVSDGTLTLNSDGSFTYTPRSGFSGTDTFTYKANDGMDDSNVATVTIEVDKITTFGLDAGNNTYNEYAGVIEAMRFENTAGTGKLTKLELLFDDTTPADNVTLGVFADNGGVPGSLLLDAGEVAVADGWVAISGLDLSVTQGTYYWLAFNLQSANGVAYLSGQPANSHYWAYAAYGPLPAQFNLVGALANNSQYVMRATVILAGNNAPVAVDDAYSTNEDITLNEAAPGVLGNDTDADGDPLTAVLVSDVGHGTLTLNADGSFTYVPDADFNGADSFTYKANDGVADSNEATVSITVNAVNDAPVAVNDAYSVHSGTTLNEAAPGVLGNDTDADSDPLTAVLVSDVSDGALTLNGDGSFTYTPNAGFAGSDSFTYKANDGAVDSNVATVSITVTNNAPVAIDDAYSVAGGTTLNEAAPGVLGNDTDVDGDSLTAVLVDDVTEGTLTLNSDGSFNYTPNAGFSGTDSFTYKANDGVDDSNVATVTITVDNSATFGLDSGSATYSENSGILDAMRFQNTAGAGTLTKLEILFDDASTNGKVRLGVYADVDGAPANLLLDAGEVTVTDGWVVIDELNLPVEMDAYYWLAFILQDANGIRYEGGQPANSHYWITYVYGPLPLQFSGSDMGANSNEYVMRATVTFSIP